MKPLLVAALITITGCTSINNIKQNDLERIQIGKSTKSDVVNAIGLPDKVVKTNSDVEEWLYKMNSVKWSYFIPMPVSATSISSSTILVNSIDIGKKDISSQNSETAVLEFGTDKILKNIRNEK